MNKVFLLMLFFISTRSLALAQGTHNYYHWNRFNHILQNGKIQSSPWYEWWYYKIVLPDSGESFYSVYGVVNPWDTSSFMAGTRAYVGFGDFSSKIMSEERFLLKEFSASYDSVDVRVGGKNIATDRHFEGELNDPISGIQRWSVDIVNKWTFNAMGWAMQIPRITNIAWYPAQADANCSGRIESNGKVHDFKDAPCYQDRNWGTSFPEWWAWIVSNHFHEEDAAIAIGGGLPEVLGNKIYSGVSVGFKFRGREYTFRPNDLDNVRTKIKWGEWSVIAKNKDLRIEVEATAPAEKFMDLQFVTPTGEVFHDYETLTGHLVVRVFDARSGRKVATLTSDLAGIEYGSASSQKIVKEIQEQTFSHGD